MIVVSDASPLHYLILIGHESLLPTLYGSVVIPQAVAAELSHARTPPLVSAWIASPPHWMQIQIASKPDADGRLDLGEREAIGLAVELRADALLIDERRGRKVAQKRGLAIIGTLGVLVRASDEHLLHLPEAIRALKQTGMRLDDQLIRQALFAAGHQPE